MKLLVCLTHVPDTAAKIAFDTQGTALNTERVQFVIGPYDDFALGRAVELKKELSQDGTDVSVTLGHIGDATSDATLRKGLAIGADQAIRVNTTATDARTVAKALAYIVEQKGPFDLILLGRETSDFNQGLVPGMLSALTDIEVITPVMRLVINQNTAEIEQEIAGGVAQIKAQLPLILGCQEPIADWKIPNMRDIMNARNKPLEVLDYEAPAALSTAIHFEVPKPREDVQLVEDVQTLVQLLERKSKVL